MIRKIITIVFTAIGAGCFAGILFFAFLLMIGSRLLVNLESQKALEDYANIYNILENEDFLAGEIDMESQAISLIRTDNSYEEVAFKSNFSKSYIHSVWKDQNGDIGLLSRGGIFRSDREIVFSKKLNFDQSKYSNIKRIDENMFLCELRY